MLVAPPGVTRIVPGGGGAIASEAELELLELELAGMGVPHGSIAMVCVSELLGITISLDPGGILLLPEAVTTAASLHEVTAIVSGLCCLGTVTVLTPGLISAVATGSMLELEEPPLLPPHAATTPAQATRAATRPVTDIMLLMFSPPRAADGHSCMGARILHSPTPLASRTIPITGCA